MDNLTHSLVGALIGQMGLKRKSGLGMAALIISANIPDIDATCTIYGIESLAMRRGLTHAPVAMVVLPVVLTGLLIAYDRWRPNAARLPVRPGWLYLLALIGTLSHPALDWLNSYGIRLLEPFSSQWFYGDSIFIIDVWLWAAMTIGFVWSRRREKAGHANWRRPAAIAFDAVCTYIFLNGVITGIARHDAAEQMAARGLRGAPVIVTNPVPLQFWRREILWRDDGSFGSGTYSLGQGAVIAPGAMATGMDNPAIARARENDPEVRAFLFWSRMPVARVEGGKLLLSDQRFGHPLVSSRFKVEIPQ
jgi:inner membrane protein